jgi:hypothetical protein
MKRRPTLVPQPLNRRLPVRIFSSAADVWPRTPSCAWQETQVQREPDLIEERDLVDELIEERTRQSPEFPAILAAAERARANVKALTAGESGSV